MITFKNKQQELVYIPAVSLIQRKIKDDFFDIEIELDKNRTVYKFA